MNRMKGQSDRPELTIREWVALLVLVCTAFSSQMAVPLWVAAVMHQMGLSAEAAGRVAAVEFGTVAAVSFVTGLSLQRLPIKLTVAAGMAMLVVGNFASLFANGALPLTVARTVCGVGKGAIVAVGFGLLAGTRNPTRSFGVLNAAYAGFAAAFYLVLPIISTRWGAAGIFLCMTAAVAVGAAMVPLFPRTLLATGRTLHLPLRNVPPFGWQAVSALVLLALVHAGLWTFVGAIGVRHGCSPAQIGGALSFGALITMAGPTLAGLLNTRAGIARPLGAALVLKTMTAVALILTKGPTSFFILAPTFLLLNLFIIPYMMGMISLADPSGRIAGASSAGQQAGNAAGALIVGLVLSRFGFVGLSAVAALLFISVLFFALLAAPSASRTAKALFQQPS